MAPKRRDASEFSKSYTPPKQPRTTVHEAGGVAINVATVWLRPAKGVLCTFQMKDAAGGDAFRNLFQKVKDVAPALLDKKAMSLALSFLSVLCLS